MARSQGANRLKLSAHNATLECGTVLEYEAAEFVPRRGDLVPCRHHGFCVTEAATKTGGWSQRHRPPARPRAQQDLLDWMRHRQETTVHALRRQRFTLRMVVAAERNGHLSVDIHTGRVALRPVQQRAD